MSAPGHLDRYLNESAYRAGYNAATEDGALVERKLRAALAAAEARATRAEGDRDAARALLFDLAAAVRLLEEIGAPVSPLAKMRRINAEDLLGEKATPAIPPRYDFRTKRAARAAGEAQKATAP
jgi:succinate dehydrogenase/fumarate reductase flavoprotein subunit